MKHLGQHFLKNKAAIKKIVAALEIEPGDTIIEIGAGHGELTYELLAVSFELLDKKLKSTEGIKIIAVEKDEELVQTLREKFAASKNVEVVRGDILKILPELTKNYKLKAKSYKIVGNLPFYLTGYLLRLAGQLEPKPKRCVFTLQKEVAERLAAKPPAFNKLAASVQFWAKPEIIGLIPKSDFSPTPEVDAAIVKLETRIMNHESRAVEDYYRMVNILFRQPRKTILNNLEFGKWEMGVEKSEIARRLKEIGIDPNDRPQNLSVEDIVKISALF